jgi:hypothetical protein
MSQLEEAVARPTQARIKLAPITERILDIETRLAVAAPPILNVQRQSFTARAHLESIRLETASYALDHHRRKVGMA